MSYPYYEVSAIIDGQFEREVLFGSYNQGDARYELQAEKESWKAEGYRVFAITNKQVEDAPDPSVYPELYNSAGKCIN